MIFTRLAGDASFYGIGAVLSHVFADGTERPVPYASQTLLQNEQNYAQVEKEALLFIFGVATKIPTTHLQLLAAMLQRWALLLSADRYNIEFKPTLTHANTDGLPSPSSKLKIQQQIHQTQQFSVFGT